MSNNHETDHATNTKPVDLMALSTRVIQRNKCNSHCNFVATAGSQQNSQLNGCTVSPYKHRNHATSELHILVNKISRHYGGDEGQFLAEYFDDILMNNDIERTLACFRDLSKQISSVKNR